MVSTEKTTSRSDSEQTLAAPSIALPKGGGAIRGMGEKFAANPVTGTGSMTVPIATSPGRSGFGPQLSLSYDSGAGNGPFGIGWNLSLPSITRKTDKGLPQYRDGEESDVFILSGAEDLVPVLQPDGTQFKDDTTVPGYVIHRYRPRIEGLFARIERWTNVADPKDVHWRSISGDNVLTLYGKGDLSRIADPENPQHIFSWLICETRDDKGNAVVYQYKREDGVGVDLTQAHQRNRGDRDDLRRTANRYLKHVTYGNRKPLLDDEGQRPPLLTDAAIQDAGWQFQVVFDYGEHDPDVPTPNDAGPWTLRDDPFSTYRAGFEVRTTRLCQRVLMFHHFPDEPGVGNDCLVRSTDFTYSHEQDPDHARNPVYTFLLAVAQSGYKRDNGGYLKRSLPPVEFEYTRPVVQDTVEEVDPASLENLPIGLDGAMYRWTDLHGEGIPGILTEQGGGWFYKRNLSPLTGRGDNETSGPAAQFAPVERVAVKPNLALADGAQFMDLAGDGQPDLVVMDGPMPGLYEHNGDEGWQPFRPFTARLNRDTRDPNLKFVDLDGDGHADVLITEDDDFVWHPSLDEAGFGPARRMLQALDEEKGPRLVFADGTQSIYLADMSGDGLTDLARLRNGEVCYWPNLGYGRFGAKVTMDHAPHFDNPDQFDQKRIRLADIDGSGTTDIIYLHRHGVRLYFNQSGNSWSEAQKLAVFPRIDDLASVMPVDLLGNGTACLVWSSSLPGDATRPMRYVNLIGQQKPHLLVKTVNNLGAETHVHYAPSTRFYLEDKRNGKPWITRLPFPVHVVERVETYDHISRNRFVSRYAYHHGYFDGEEREFRGFGMVEQWDTEEFAAFGAAGDFPVGVNIDAASHVPPVHTKTWFHIGVYLDREHISRQFEDEYYREPGLSDNAFRALLLPDTTLPTGLTLEEEREACRALKGMMLRQEVYADDAGPRATEAEIERARTPYTVVEQDFAIRPLQPRASNRHAVFFSHPHEAITYHYERNPVDPRIQHALTLDVDDFGNVLKEAAIGYGRRQPDPDLPTDNDRVRQTHALLTYTENRVTNDVESADTHRGPLPCEARTFELTDYMPTGTAGRYQASDFVEPDPAAPGRLRPRPTDQVAYESVANGNPCRRPIEWMRTLYRPNDMGEAHNDPNALLALGELQSLALPGESYQLAFTQGLLTQVFQRPQASQSDESLLPDPIAVLGGQAGRQGGYLQSQTLKADGRFPVTDADDHWWIPSGRSFFTTNPIATAATELAEARQHFFLTRRYRDPFGHDAFVDFDGHDLLMTETRDALGNRVTVDANDYRVLQPRLVSDPNRNQTEVVFDVLGLVVATAVMGKPGEGLGDSLDGFAPEPSDDQLDAFVAAPRQASASPPNESEPTQVVRDLLGQATTRILYDLDRFQRLGEPPFAATIARETHVSDLDLGKESKLQISFSHSDGFGREIQQKIQAEPGPLAESGLAVNPRWVGSGWTIFNNKGNPVRQYEPFFSATHRFEFGVMAGVSPVLFYDPLDRVVATLHPNHTWHKVVFDPWQQTTFDVNDTCAARNAQTGDLRTDPDISGYVAEYFKALPINAGQPWETWYEQRIGGDLGQEERQAAQRAEAHADTPTTAHFDALGRPFLTLARNRVVCAGHDLDGTEESFATRVELDIEGNQRAVLDERKLPVSHLPTGALEQRVVMRYAYDMLGNRIHQASMEAGARWTLNDVAGNPIHAWDSRGHNFTTTYDALRRPVEQTVRGTIANGEAASDPRTLNPDILVDKIEYGEPLPNATLAEEAEAQRLNLRTRIHRHLDSAGEVINSGTNPSIAETEAYDFKGNLLRNTQRLITDYKAIPDWQFTQQLGAEIFESSARYDALNRPTQSIAPHSNVSRPGHPNKINVIQPVFNEANLLERVDVWLARVSEPGALLDRDSEAPSAVGVANIDYDAKGQRQRINYKNGVSTVYDYDPLTFRLTHLLTLRSAADFLADDPQPPVAGWPGRQLQNLCYTYDPAGNITHIHDDAQQTIYFRNQRVEPSNDYTYDALYRLIEATGREHLGQTGGAPIPHSHNDASRVGLLHPGDGDALGTYVERYVYDAVGNFLQMQHRGSDPAHAGWTRRYEYGEASLIEAGKQSNRLSSTHIGNGLTSAPEPYQHDAHGNMTRMPHLPMMRWDYRDQLQTTAQQAVTNGGTPETTYYVYDAAGQRVRKVTERYAPAGQPPRRKAERLYLGGFEIYREYESDGVNVALERETLHIIDDQQRIALVETRTEGSEAGVPAQLIRYQFGNHLSSASLELDVQAQVISYEEYAPYGSTTYQAVRSQTETAKRYRYTGKERDEESGLYYHGARYYAPWVGRWVSCDPAGFADGLCIYAYARGNPIIYRDIDGRISEDTKENFKQLGRDIWGSWKQMTDVTEKYDKVAEAYKQGGVSESAAVVLGVDELAERALYYEDHGASTSETVALMISEKTGMTDVLEAATGESLEGEPLTTGERIQKGISGGAGVVGTAIGGVQGIRSLKGTPGTPNRGIEEPKITRSPKKKPGTRKGSAKPTPDETLVGSSIDQMKRKAAKVIAADADHPLKFLLDDRGKFKPQKGMKHPELMDRPDIVQMGHIESKKLGGQEKVMLQGGWENQFNNLTIEGRRVRGGVIDQPAIDIGGVAVDRKTAQGWESFGLLKRGTVDASPRVIF